MTNRMIAALCAALLSLAAVACDEDMADNGTDDTGAVDGDDDGGY